MQSKMNLVAAIFFVICGGLSTSTVWGATAAQHLKMAQNVWTEAENDKSPTLSETDTVIQKLRQALRSPLQLKFADEKIARLLLAEAYRTKAIIISPSMTISKDGLMYFEKARLELLLILRKAPRDLEALRQYVFFAGVLRMDVEPAYAQLIELQPTTSWVWFDLANSRRASVERVEGQERIAKLTQGRETFMRAIKLSESASALRQYLGDSGLPWFSYPDCPWPADVDKLIAQLPDSEDVDYDYDLTNKQAKTQKPKLIAIKTEIFSLLSAQKCPIK